MELGRQLNIATNEAHFLRSTIARLQSERDLALAESVKNLQQTSTSEWQELVTDTQRLYHELGSPAQRTVDETYESEGAFSATGSFSIETNG